MKRLINLINWIELYFKGGEIMMAMFFAQRIILEKCTFAQVPKVLKPRVKEILIESGLEILVTEDK